MLVQRRARRPMSEARSFVLVRSQAGLVQARINPGPVTSVSLWMAGASNLSVIRRNRITRVWLNGRSVTSALDTSEVTHVTGSLSASHGLRPGVNGLRILVVEPDQGRYALLRRSFRASGRSLLPAAGLDVETPVHDSVRLDGRRSRRVGRGRLHYEWKIVSAPRGSHATLRGASSTRPFLTPDRPGHYVVALTVSDGATRARASRSTAPETDRVTVDAGPSSLLVLFQGLTEQSPATATESRSVTPPTASMPTPSRVGCNGSRSTARPSTPTGTGNNYFDGTAHGDHGIDALTKALCRPVPGSGCTAGLNQLVIFSFAGFGGGPVQSDQVKAFNKVLQTIGVGPIDSGILMASNKLVIVGIPFAGAGSGWYTHGGSKSHDALAGWLMPDTAKEGDAFLYRLQPEQPAFNTSSASTVTTNTMTIRDQHVDAALPSGASGGFEVVIVDPIDFAPVDHATFATNDRSGHPIDSGLRDLAGWLNARRALGYLVAVQSIGTVHGGRNPIYVPRGPSDAFLNQASHDLASDPWYQVGTALSDYGANPHTFNIADGKYAFFGGSGLERTQDAQSSSAVEVDPTTKPHPTTEPGVLSGRGTMRADGDFMPTTIAGPGASFEDSLHDIVFRPSTPWPYTAGGSFPQQRGCPAPGHDAAAYAKALSFIAVNINLPGYASDLRRAYVERNQSQNWSGQGGALGRLSFEPGHGFGEAEFCNLAAELQQEFTWLDNVQGLFQSYVDVLQQSDGSLLVQSIGKQIREAVTQSETGTEIGWSIGAFLGNLGSAAILGFFPEATPALAAWEALVTFYELARELVSDLKGAPIGDQVTSKVEDLESDVANRVTDAWNGLYRLRQVISSDYGRLHALGPAASGPGWQVDLPSTSKAMNRIAGAFFYSQLMPIPYGVHAIFDFGSRPVYDVGTEKVGATLDSCDNFFGSEKWHHIPDTAWLRWIGDFDRNGYRGWFPTTFALGVHTLGFGNAYPPKELTDPMFTPISQGGTGMQIADLCGSSTRSGSRQPTSTRARTE